MFDPRSLTDLDLPKVDLPTIDVDRLTSFDLTKVDLSKVDLSKVDLPKVDLPEIDTDRLFGLARDAAYISIGLGVLTVQQTQVRRRELQRTLGAQVRQVRERIDALR